MVGFERIELNLARYLNELHRLQNQLIFAYVNYNDKEIEALIVKVKSAQQKFDFYFDLYYLAFFTHRFKSTYWYYENQKLKEIGLC